MSKKRRAQQAASAPDMSAPNSLPRLVFSEASLSAAKWLAVLLMVMDHANKYLLDGSVPWMYGLGRVSMPLFAVVLGFNLAREGMLEKGGYRRLLQRLACFGLLASVPFVALNQLWSGWWPLNMMFSLLVATATAWLIDLQRPGATIAACIVLVWGGALCEYWWPGIGLVLCVWAYTRRPSRMLILVFLVCLVLLWLINGNHWALAVVPVLYVLHWWRVVLPRMQWVFYAFYPAHLALFWAVLQLR